MPPCGRESGSHKETCNYSDQNQGDTKAAYMFFGQAALFFLLAEAFTLFFVAGKIGFFKTLFLWFCSAALGAFLIQRQGLAAVIRAQGVFNRGSVPVDDFFDGLCLLLAGLLFMVPGFISDALAFMLLIPFIRKLLRDKNPRGFGIRTAYERPQDEGVIDGTYVRVDKNVDAIEQRSDTSGEQKGP